MPRAGPGRLPAAGRREAGSLRKLEILRVRAGGCSRWPRGAGNLCQAIGSISASVPRWVRLWKRSVTAGRSWNGLPQARPLRRDPLASSESPLHARHASRHCARGAYRVRTGHPCLPGEGVGGKGPLQVFAASRHWHWPPARPRGGWKLLDLKWLLFY